MVTVRLERFGAVAGRRGIGEHRATREDVSLGLYRPGHRRGLSPSRTSRSCGLLPCSRTVTKGRINPLPKVFEGLVQR
jgi:hypothetical protein